MSNMMYWIWLYNKIKDINKEQLKEVWETIRVISGILLINSSIVVASFYLIDNYAIAMVTSLVVGLFFSLTWLFYNVEKD